jgi:hypothetical protein
MTAKQVVTIRRETPSDRLAVRGVNTAAFDTRAPRQT